MTASTCPPTSGANTGATPVTAISSANTRAADSAVEQVANDRARDHHAGAAEGSLDEAKHDQDRIEGAAAHASDAKLYPARPASKRPAPAERVARAGR